MARHRHLLALGALPLAVLGLFFAYPVLGMAARGFADGPGAVLGVLARERTQQVLWFTLWSAGLATVLAVLLGVPVAYTLYRLRVPGRWLLRVAVVVPFVLPTVVVGVAFRQLLAPGGWLGSLGLDGSAVAIVAALVFFNVAVVVRTVGAMWESLDPRREESARVLGATRAQAFLTITLPALLPAIAAAATVVFLYCATAFGVVLTLGGLRHANIETEIWLLTSQQLDLTGAAALSILQVLVIVVLLALAARLDRSSDRAGAAQEPARPTRGDLPVLAWTSAVLAALALPLAALVVRSLEYEGRWSLRNYAALAGDNPALAATAAEALSNSLQIAVVAATFAVGLGGLVSWLVTQPTHGRWASLVLRSFDTAFMLPLGVSAVTVGFGFLVTLGRPPLALLDWPWLVPIAQAMVALPLVVRTVTPVLRAIDDRQRQVAASLGASRWRVFLTVEMPLAWRALLAATGFAFAISLGEFGATSFLVRDEVPTLPVVIYRLIGHPGAANAGTAMAASVVLALLTAAVMLLVERTRVRGVGAF